MALSWFFGGKKKDEKIVTAPEAIEVGSDEDYAIIHTRKPSNKNELYPIVPPLPYPTSPGSQFYTPLPQKLPQYQQMTTGPSAAVVQNQLEGVPFVLAQSLDQTSSRSSPPQLEELRRAVFQTAADINDCSYNFNLEASVIREASL